MNIDRYTPYTGADTPSQSANNGTSSNPSADSYDISDSEKELNYMMDMLFMNGAGSSSIPSVQMAYEWVSNPDNKGKEIPQNVLDTYYAFLGGVDNSQIARSNQIAVGKDDELGFVKDIYEAKKENQQKSSGLTDAETQKLRLKFYYSTGKPSPLTTYDLEKLYEYLNISLGEAGQTVLGDIIKPDPEAYGKRSGILMEAYKAGLMGYDFSKESINIARGEGYLGDVLKMYQAGETDKKMAEEKAELDELENSAASDLTNDFYKAVLGSLDIGNSQDVNVQKAYQTAYDYFNNSANNGKEIPEDVKNALNTFFQSVDSDKKVEVLKGMGLEGLTRMVELSDGSYSKTEQNIIPIGPYAGRTVNQGFNDPTTNYQGHMGYDIGGEYGSDIVPILDGKVAYFTEDDSTLNGWMVVIEHELPDGTKYYSSYSHLEKHAENLYVGMKVSTDTVIGSMGGSSGGDPHGVGTHLHLMVYTRVKPYETPYILDPHGYASKVKKEGTRYNKYNFENAGCTYNQYYCITPNYKGDINDYHFIVFYDPLVVMLTNGGIISLFPYEYIKKG